VSVKLHQRPHVATLRKSLLTHVNMVVHAVSDCPASFWSGSLYYHLNAVNRGHAVWVAGVPVGVHTGFACYPCNRISGCITCANPHVCICNLQNVCFTLIINDYFTLLRIESTVMYLIVLANIYHISIGQMEIFYCVQFQYDSSNVNCEYLSCYRHLVFLLIKEILNTT